MDEIKVSLLEKSKISSSYVFPAQIVFRFLGMLTTVVLARNLTTEQYGVYNLFLGSVLIFNFLSNPGLAGSLQRFLPEYFKLEKFGYYFRTLFFAISYRSISGLIVFIVGFLLFDQVAVFFDIAGYRLHYVFFSLGLYALFQVDFLLIALNSLFLHQYSSLGEIIYQSIRLVLIYCFLVLFADRLIGVYLGELIAYGFGMATFWLLFVRKAQKVYAPKTKSSQRVIEWRRFLRFSAYNAATIPGGILFSNAMDYFVVAAMATVSQTGVYALGARASNMLLSVMPQKFLQTVIRPVFYHNYSSGDGKSTYIKQMFRSVVKLVALPLFPTVALVGLNAESILSFVFNAQSPVSTEVFLLFLVFGVSEIIELPSDLVLQSLEKVQARLYAQVFAIYNIVAAVLLMPKYGLLGVVFATGSAAMGKRLLWYFMARYYIDVSICWKALLKITINALMAVGISSWISTTGRSFMWVIASLGTGYFAYVIFSLINNPLDDYEKGLLNRFFKRRVFNV